MVADPQLLTDGSVPQVSAAAAHMVPLLTVDEHVGKLGVGVLQTVQPSQFVLPSDLHVISSPAAIVTSDGPVEPPYLVPPIVK